MSISVEPGTSLAHYRVIAPLGAGGMGEVYKAQDLTLDRTVALKILPPELVRNDERVRRFMQEARSASSLNHPNIVTIYEIGQADSIHYIAMELIDGATLKRRIHESDADLRTLLGLLAQAAEGLAKAHAAGIVHRDLKPENIMVTRDGYAKVLDFGLAKLTVNRSPEATKDPTIARENTREGTLLGTVGYMSPEQVQAKPVDHRSDIFSFGSILYEAATKRRPFEADSDIDIMHKIVHDKPPAIDEIDPTVPAELRRLIRRCMAKDPEKRHQSMKNLSLELMEIVEEFEVLSASATSASRSASGPIAAPPRRAWIPAVIIAAVVIAGLAVWQWPKRTATQAAAPFASMQLAPLTTTGNVADAAISPDGKYVAQIIRRANQFSLMMRQAATGSDVEVVAPGEAPLFYVSFSRDGDYIYYVQYDNAGGAGYGTLYRIAALGGPPRKILFDVDTKVSESPDGKQITFVRGDPATSRNHLIVANADGTGVRILETYARVAAPLDPVWSPDGKTILLPRRSATGADRAQIVATDVASGTKRVVGRQWEQPGNVAWLPDGSGIVTTAMATNTDRNQIWLQPYPDGEPARITNDLHQYAFPSVTTDGKTLAALQFTEDFDLSIVEGTTMRPFTDRMGSARKPIDLGVARTGAVVVDLDTDKGVNVAMIDAPGAAPRLLTNDGSSAQPSITADGKTVAFRSRRDNGVAAIYVMDSDGGNVRRLATGVRPVIAPDGSFVIYMSREDTSLWQIPIGGGTPVRIAERTNVSHTISPDSKRIAYTYRKIVGGRNVLYLAVVPAGGGPLQADIQLSTTGVLRFDSRGENILFRRPAGGGINVFAQPLSGGPPKQITSFTSGETASFDYAPDGKLIVTGGEVRSDVVLIRNFR